MLLKIAAFEFRQAVRSPLFWAVVGVFFLLTFGFMASGRIQIGDTANVHKNSPYAVIQIHLILSLFFMFAAAAFVAGSLIRDDETGFGPIVRSTSVSRFDYLYGRFAGSFAAALLAFAAVSAGLIAGSFLPGVDPDRLGPFRAGTYLYAYFVMAGPMLLLTSAAFFTLAAATRSYAWVFAVVIVLVTAYALSGIALGRPDLEPIAGRWDPVGMFSFDVATRYWTVSERNSLLPALSGALLFNRLFCLALGTAALALAWPLHRDGQVAASGAGDASADAAKPPARARRLTPASPSGTTQFLERARFDLNLAFRSPVLWVVLGLALANAAVTLWTQTDDGRFGTAVLPVTRLMIEGLDRSFTIFVVIIAAYFAGELVWRDRDRRMHEIVDAAPAPDWMFVAPKAAALALLLTGVLAVGALAGIGVQTAKGWRDYQLGEYALWYLAPGAVDLTILAALAVFGQVIAPNKFAGWGVMLLYIVAEFALPANGFEHNLYIYGGASPVPLSDMNGQGRFWIGAWWFRAYWSAWALALLVAAHALWRRGETTALGARLRAAPRRLAGAAGWTGLAALLAATACGAFVFYNTNILNPYRTARGDDLWRADYEKTLLRYESTPQPSVAAVTLDVVIDPGTPSVETRGVYVLRNDTNQPLREVHVRFARDLVVRALSVQGAWPLRTYERFNYRIFAFDQPMNPGETRTLSFDTLLAERGFRNAQQKTRDLTRVVANGTFVDSSDIAPIIGMDRSGLLTDRTKRRRYGLSAALTPPPLGDRAAQAHNYVHADWATSDITVTTSADQTPLAPGDEVADLVTDGKRTARFVSTRPILDFFSIQSARYAVRSETHRGVKLLVYYDPQHGANVGRMLRALAASLDYYEANFGPYQFRQARIVEFPDYARFAQSFAGTFPWSEGLGFIADDRDPARIDMVSYVAAHEFAHQWWAHQIIGADEQGATALSETLAQYSALEVMRRLYGPDHIHKFLKYELDGYLRARGGQTSAEQPLDKVAPDQGYIHYNKGALVMYRLADEIGEAAVNRALRSLLARYAFKGPPYPTSLDLVGALRAQAPADKQQLITDLFENITIYDLKAERATAHKRPDGRWDVALTVSAQKAYADGNGAERPAPMDEAVDLGLFARRPGDKAFGPRDVIMMHKAPVTSGEHIWRFVTAVKPSFAGVDPYDELIDRNSGDNIVAVR